MKIYVTRHGQVDFNAKYLNGDVSLPVGETPLSELGRQQATLLGRRMKQLGFKGKVLASPLLRTMETAELIAKEIDAEIVPTPWFHEIFGNQKELDAYRGHSVEELRALFSNISQDAFMEKCWWPSKRETFDNVCARVSKGLTEYMEENAEDIILVGHAASAAAALKHFELWTGGILWNCGLSLYDTDYPENNVYNEVSHLPEEAVSCNKIMGADIGFDSSYTDLYPIEIPSKLRMEKSTKLLHIGDTHSETYLYYRQLIQMIKPDIIVHTGDTVDEVKVGRDEGTKAEYLTKAQVMLDILESANCKAYWVPGNNDLPEEIAKRAPFVEVVSPDTVLKLEGTDICVTHSKEQITKKADIYLYGHGRRAESAKAEKCVEGSDALYLNVKWNTRVCILPKKEIYEFERPEYRKGIWEHE